MRTDAKVGLVGILVVAIAVVTYFVYHQPSQTEARTASDPAPSLNTATTVPAPGVVVSPPASDNTLAAVTPAAPAPAAPAPAYATAPTLAQAPLIAPPSSDSSSVPPTPTASTQPSPDSVRLVPPGSRTTLLPPVNPPTPTTAPTIGSSYPGTSYPPATGTSTLDNTHNTHEISPEVRPGDSLIDRSSTPTIGGASNPSTYTIQSGDTFTTIAKKFNTTVKAIQAANPKVDSSHLKIKQVINLPAAGTGTSTPSTPSTPTATTRPGHSPTATTRPSNSSAAAGTTYTVKKGDTLRKIAKAAYGDENQWNRIFRANRGELDSADDIEVGMVLKLPPK